jgi:hypothetical protein
MNCHNQNPEHPYFSEKSDDYAARKKQMTNRCLNCHTYDQSPEWYNEKRKVDEEKLKQMWLKMSCPR